MSDSLLDFLQGYEPVGIEETCDADPIGPDQLAVWVNRTGAWEQMDVDTLWKGKGETESLCRHLVMNLLGMSAAQYESMRDAFEDPTALERIGIYRKEENEILYYVIVVRLLPLDYRLLLGTGAAAAIAAGGLAYHHMSKPKEEGWWEWALKKKGNAGVITDAIFSLGPLKAYNLMRRWNS